MSPAPNPWYREAVRVAPLAADLHAVDSETALRVVLTGAGKADDTIERAVARAKAWATLAPIERALIDMLTGEPVTLPAMRAELRHALPETWQAQLPDQHLETEIQLTLVSLRARGLAQVTGLDGEHGDLLAGWGSVPEDERRALYAADHIARALAATHEIGGYLVSTTRTTPEDLREGIARIDITVKPFAAYVETRFPVLVPITYPANRCAAPGCGEKIKGTSDGDTCWFNGEHYFERECCDENGNPQPQGEP